MVSQTTAAACYNSLLLAREYFALASAWFYRVQLVYILCIAFVGGSIVYGVQGSAAPYNYIDCAFIMTSAVTGCGLQTFDMTPMHSGSKVAIFMAALVGGSVFVSVTPSTYRRLVIWRAARVALRCSTGKEPRLAAYLSTHLEYRALGWVRLLVLLYWASVQLVVWLSLGIYLSVYTGAATLSERSGMSPVWFSAFIANMGFANVGLVPLVRRESQQCGLRRLFYPCPRAPLPSRSRIASTNSRQTTPCFYSLRSQLYLVEHCTLRLCTASS